MATESPIRIAGNSRKWSNSGRDVVPNRSGSAPPSIEGSYLAMDNLLTQQGSDHKINCSNYHDPFHNRRFDESIARDPSYLAYYSSRLYLNPRVSPWVHSTQNQRFNNREINDPVQLSHASLATHKEVAEEESCQDQSDHIVSDQTNGFISGSDVHLSPDGRQGLDCSQQDITSQSSRSNSSSCENDDAANTVKSTSVEEIAASDEVDDSTAHESSGNHSTTHNSIARENNPNVSTVVSKMKNTNISNAADPENRHIHEQIRLPQQQISVSSSIQGSYQPMLQSSGLNFPHYGTTPPAYITPSPVYNMQAPGIYSPQYDYGTLTPNISPHFITGYPPHGAVPFVVSPNFIPQISGSPSMGNVVHGVGMQYSDKLYSPAGQPSYQDPHYMQYYQQPFGQAYTVPCQMSPMVPRSAVPGNQNVAGDAHKAPRQISGPGNQNPGKIGMMGFNYHGIQPNTGFVVHYPLGAPISPGSPQFVDAGPTWQSPRGLEGSNGPRSCNFLEELKSGKGRRFELSDIAGHIVQFSTDQHGSRFIQQKLETCSPEEKSAVFKEVLPHACRLMTDVFGNYVIQKFFEFGSPVQRKELADQLRGQILPLSLQMYGCRVIQKALDAIEPEQKGRLVRELDGQVMRCVRDQNGNHVIQKCIESIPTDKIGFLMSAFHGNVASLSMHPYGCRVIQRVLECCSNEQQCGFIIEEILESVCVLSKDQYGNYVAQHILEKGTSQERERIVRKLSGHIIQLSQHKFASNVIEKCLEYGGPTERDIIIKEVAGDDEGYSNLLTMMKDQYGNYVVQKIFETCSDDQRDTLRIHVRMHASALKKYTYGKHIVSCLEHLFGEDCLDCCAENEEH